MSQRNRTRTIRRISRIHSNSMPTSACLQYYRHETSMRTNTSKPLNPSSDLTGLAAIFQFEMAFFLVFSLFLDGVSVTLQVTCKIWSRMRTSALPSSNRLKLNVHFGISSKFRYQGKENIGGKKAKKSIRVQFYPD